MMGDIACQLDFVAMNSLEEGVGGVVKFSNSEGEAFMGKVTGYFQKDNVACFVGRISKTNVEDWKYFYVAVCDNGEGNAAPADCGVQVLAGSTPYEADIDLATGNYETLTGNVQVH